VSFSCRYLATYVSDLEAAEAFYTSVFDLGLLFRESRQNDESWHTLRDDLGWDEIYRRGIHVDMVALERDEFVLALLEGRPREGTLYEICVAVEAPEVEATRGRLPDHVAVEEFAPGWLRFIDPFGFRWTVRDRDVPFRSSGDIAERWLG
jgi:catechol 2,3-dioxygenase-like lactoylglutathione lyase family enzyme